MTGIFDVLDDWGLSNDNVNLNKYNKKNFRSITEDIERSYANLQPDYTLGKIHLGITDSIKYMESSKDLSGLAIPLLSSQQMWLPDPTYSFFSIESLDIWGKMPDSGSKYFSNTPSIHTNWVNYWGTKKDNRVEYLEERLPGILENMKKIRTLAEHQAVYLYPWELVVKENLKDMKDAVNSLRKHEIFDSISTKYTQQNYNLGPRLGAIGITLTEDHNTTGLKAGENLWIGDKTPVLVCGLLNTMLTEQFGANFLSPLSGDRLVHDFIRSGGESSPQTMDVSNSLKFPNLSNAVWEDIVAIRKDSETLALFRDIIKDASYIDEEKGLEAIKLRLDEAIAKIKEDKSLWKVAEGAYSELAIGAFGGFLSCLGAGSNVSDSMLGGVTGAGVTFLWKLYKGYADSENRDARTRVDLLMKINNKL